MEPQKIPTPEEIQALENHQEFQEFLAWKNNRSVRTSQNLSDRFAELSGGMKAMYVGCFLALAVMGYLLLTDSSVSYTTSAEANLREARLLGQQVEVLGQRPGNPDWKEYYELEDLTKSR